jgi:ribosomal protein L32
VLYRPKRREGAASEAKSREREEVISLRLCSKGHKVPMDASVCPECGEVFYPYQLQTPEK